MLSSLILCSNNELFLKWIVMCDEKWILWQPTMTTWLNWEEAPKHFPEPYLYQKKSHGHCLVVCYCSDPLQFSESQWNHYIWEVCSTNQWDAMKTAMPSSLHWSTEWAQFFSSTMPNHMSHNQHFRSWMKWAAKFCLCSPSMSAISIWPLIHWLPTTPSSTLTTFCRENASQPAGGRKCFPRVHWILKHGFLCNRNIQTYFSLAKMCWL